MNRTRIFIVAVISAAVVLVVGILAWRTITGNAAGRGLAACPPTSRSTFTSSLPFLWNRGCGLRLMNSMRQVGDVDGTTFEVEIIPMDGLVALGMWERNDFDALPTDVTPRRPAPRKVRRPLRAFPTAWIADGRFLVDIANASIQEQLGSGPVPGRRAISREAAGEDTSGLGTVSQPGRSICLKISARSRGPQFTKQPLLQPVGRNWAAIPRGANSSWRSVHPARVWAARPPSSQRQENSLKETRCSSMRLYDPQFGTWLTELLGGSATRFQRRRPSSTAESVALFGYTAGDGGQFLESDLLQYMEGIQNPLAGAYSTSLPKGDYLVRLSIRNLGRP